MLRFMYSGISGMKANQTKLDVIGNNISNVSTTAFKGSSARFKDMIYQTMSEASQPTSVLGGTNAKQVGLGTQVSSINKVIGQGNVLSTGRSLDVCVADGDGYFVVAKGATDAAIAVDQNTGASTGSTGTLSETLYTRDGNLSLDKDGNLLTSDGHRIMGYYLKTNTQAGPSVKYLTADDTTVGLKAGQPEAQYVDANDTTLAKADNNLHPLAIPDAVVVNGKLDPVQKFVIGSDGVITAVLGSGATTAIGQIAMATFKNPEGLSDVGGNMALNSSNSGAPIYKTGIVPKGTSGTTDNSGAFGSIVQGGLEGSNVDLTEQFTDMITATRSFQASSKLISTGDDILQTITGLIR